MLESCQCGVGLRDGCCEHRCEEEERSEEKREELHVFGVGGGKSSE